MDPTPAPFSVRFEHNQRAYDPLYNIVVAIDAFMVATVAKTDTNYPSDKRKMNLKSRNGFPIVQFTTHEVANAAYDGRHLPIIFEINPDPRPDEIFKSSYPRTEFDFILYTASALFLIYYENVIDTVLEVRGGTRKCPPKPFDFARCIRNAIAHKGIVEWKDLTAKPVEWRGMVFSPSDDGTLIIGPRFDVSDLIILLIDCDRAIEQWTPV